MNARQDAAGIAQLPLGLPTPPAQRLETFVRPPPGAMDALRALASDSRSDWLYVEGAHGSGKTHLLLAACAYADSIGRLAAYVPLGLGDATVRELSQGMETYDLVTLDDVHLLAGQREQEIALFDLHNRLRDAGKSLIYAAEAAPGQLQWGLADLHSRLNACTRIPLSILDDTGRAEVLRARAEQRGLELEQASIDWLLKHTERDLGSLTATLDGLDRASLAAQRRITIPFLRILFGGR